MQPAGEPEVKSRRIDGHDRRRLELPDSRARFVQAADKARQNTAGCLQFIDSRSAVGLRNLFTVKPVVGDFYLWPSWMLHCVYPFKSPGVRRSIAINLALG